MCTIGMHNAHALTCTNTHNMYTQVYAHMQVHTHTHMHTYIHAHTHSHAHAYIHTHTYTHTHMHAHTHTHTHTARVTPPPPPHSPSYFSNSTVGYPTSTSWLASCLTTFPRTDTRTSLHVCSVSMPSSTDVICTCAYMEVHVTYINST